MMLRSAQYTMWIHAMLETLNRGMSGTDQTSKHSVVLVASGSQTLVWTFSGVRCRNLTTNLSLVSPPRIIVCEAQISAAPLR